MLYGYLYRRAQKSVGPTEKVDLTRCPLCSLPGPPVTMCMTSACEHGCFPPENCFRCHPERCPCRTMRTTMTLPAGATPEAQFLAAQEDKDPIPYQGTKYERSDVEFVHLPLLDFLEDRDGKLSDQFDALLRFMPAGTYIAGGSVASLMCGSGLASDIDLFFRDEAAFNEATKLLAFGGKEEHGPHVPEGVRMFVPQPGREGLAIQAINIAYFVDIEDLLDGFDFTATMFGIDVEKKELVFNPAAVFDYHTRRLLNHRSEGDDASRKRLAKYIAKGFTPAGETMRRALAFGLWKPNTEAGSLVARVVARASHLLDPA